MTWRRHVPLLVMLALVGATFVAFPPVRFHSVKTLQASQATAEGGAGDPVEALWRDKLLPAAERATDASAVLRLIAADPKAVRSQYGRSVGMSDAYFLFIRGSGRVVAVDADSIGVSLEPSGDRTDVILPLGFIFGNAVRDATDLVDASSYPNAQEYNDVSATLNGFVESRVLPELQAIAKVGTQLEFAGCAEVADEASDLKPLTLVPVYVRAR